MKSDGWCLRPKALKLEAKSSSFGFTVEWWTTLLTVLLNPKSLLILDNFSPHFNHLIIITAMINNLRAIIGYSKSDLTCKSLRWLHRVWGFWLKSLKVDNYVLHIMTSPLRLL
jgi:hypothetical protein